ncbi:MAG: hypothetical protein KKF85_00450 [Gammaproteobacteria bacterium]|nr:hypothetical protein [Rhodocyclaceae bacterium]MBU3910764.1 hypothetical protein [Gammaproteobacteria bacterium]MBU4003474.1 hypothetical protein [Gammaproteobacteria bacterium]MBU4021945.1 hypothetical protein [Gammaproteobacteria bacterium]MBU4095813.1 hypothetical protein [Gammaproteobacteria bacterium]
MGFVLTGHYWSNIYMISHPLTVVRSSGTIISATLSLGYDVHHSRVKALLIAAAQDAGLSEPFVLIDELGNHAITYRVSGLLTEIKSMLTARSALNRAILDALHGDGIEIVSPTFMNQRPLAGDARILPASLNAAPRVESAAPEEIVFDKAKQAEQQEKLKIDLQNAIRKLESEAETAEGDAQQRIAELIERKRNELLELERLETETNEGEHEIAGQGTQASKETPELPRQQA